MRVSTVETTSNNVRAEQLIAALIRHSGNISPQQAYRAAQSITEEFSLQPRNSYTMSGSKSSKKTKKSKPSKKSQTLTSGGFCHVHDSTGEVGDRGVDLTLQLSSVEWTRQNNQLVINLSRKQIKRLRAALTAYLYTTQQTGETIEVGRSRAAAA